MSSTELIVTGDGLWLRSADDPGWMAFDSATSADMFNLMDMFSPPLVLSFMIGGGGGSLLPGVRAAEPTMARPETLNGQEVMHRCWLLPEVDDGVNAYLIHYESLYTFLNNAEIHLWTAVDDTQLVRLALTGDHVGERLGEYDGTMHDTPVDFLLWMEVYDLDQAIEIVPPESPELALTITTNSGPGDTVSAPFIELPLPVDAELVGVFGESYSSTIVPREYSWLDSEIQYGVLSYYYGSGWYDTPTDRLPAYETKINLYETIDFYLDEMSSLGWHLLDTFLQGGWPVLYLFFEKDGAILPIILASDTPGVTHIAAILPPPEDVLEAVLSGWESYTTQNSDLHEDTITAIAFDAQGRAWIGTNSGLSAFDGETWATYTAEDLDLSTEGADYSVSAMAVDQNGRLWVGTRDDLSVYDGQTWKTYTPDDSEWAFLPRAMTVDSTGRVWLALGYSEIVSVFDGNTFTNYGPGDVGMPAGHAIDGIATDQQDRIWIGTSGGGVHVFDGNSWEMARREKSPPNETNLTYVIEDLAIDHRGWVWIATGEGLFVFDGQTWTTYNTENSGLVDDSIRSLGIDHSNGVWVATTGGRLNLLDTSGEWMDYTPVSSDISLYFPEAMTIDPQGRIWVGSDFYGVSVFTPPQSP
jgi:streptogramin lyase